MPAEKDVAAWLERARSDAGPIYQAIVGALEAAIQRGELQPGDRLPAQRAVAAQLGVDLTTVTRAYGLATSRGLLASEVGRGAFVRTPVDDEAGVTDLSMNLPPPPDGLSLGALLQETIEAILRRTDVATLMGYHPGSGTLGQKLAAAAWLAPCLGEIAPERLLVSPGTQAALTAALTSFCRPGDAVVAEPLTYPGFLAAAQQLGLRIVACEVDDDGPVPDALAALCRREAAKLVYLIPTLQNPTARTMPEARRRAVAAALDQTDAWLFEDDPYSRLMDAPPPAIAALRPARTVYAATLAKTLSPGLRISFVACPDAALAERIALALRAVAQMPAPLMAAAATAWIREGRAADLLSGIRAEARARRALAADILPAGRGSAESLHVWLPLASEAEADQARRAAQQRRLAVVTHEAFAAPNVARPNVAGPNVAGPNVAAPPGIRVSLGCPGTRAAVAAALRTLAEALATASPGRMVV